MNLNSECLAMIEQDIYKTSDLNLLKIYDEIIHRMQRIGIALKRPVTVQTQNSTNYDLSNYQSPSISEVENAFYNWNCAIITAFRGSKTLSKEENFKRNIERNSNLKANLIEEEMLFRSVNGCYREANWEMPNVEICFFVTNTNKEGSTLISEEQTKDFFFKLYRLSERYEQDCFLFTFPGINRVAFLVATNDEGRNDFRGDVKFAGPLFTHVPDIGDWTDCSDGRISFRLKGMILEGGTGNKRIKIGEGNLFDIEGYQPKGIVVVRGKQQDYLKDGCREFRRTHNGIPLVERYFADDDQTIDTIQKKIWGALNDLRDNKGRMPKRIGFHCSASVDGNYAVGAQVALDAVKSWLERNKKHNIEQIVVVDIYGDYSKIQSNK